MFTNWKQKLLSLVTYACYAVMWQNKCFTMCSLPVCYTGFRNLTINVHCSRQSASNIGEFINIHSLWRLAYGRAFQVLAGTLILFWAFLLELPYWKIPLSLLNPHWLSVRSPTKSRCSFRRFSWMFASIFPVIDNKEMPLWLSQTWAFPFRFYMWIMGAALNSCCTASFLDMQWKNCKLFCHWFTSCFIDLCR